MSSAVAVKVHNHKTLVSLSFTLAPDGGGKETWSHQSHVVHINNGIENDDSNNDRTDSDQDTVCFLLL